MDYALILKETERYEVVEQFVQKNLQLYPEKSNNVYFFIFTKS
jgi:hypothetical protein